LTRTTITARISVVAVLGLALTGCGGSSSSGSSATTAANAGTTAAGLPTTATTSPTTVNPTGPSLSRVQLAAKAGAICSAATAVGRKLKVPANLTTDAHAAAAYFDKAVPPLDAETKAFQALNPASAVSAQWEAVLGSQVALDRLADGFRQKADSGVQVTLADVRQLVTVGQTIANAANRLGARCL
jgi:hypothetical protein